MTSASFIIVLSWLDGGPLRGVPAIAKNPAAYHFMASSKPHLFLQPMPLCSVGGGVHFSFPFLFCSLPPSSLSFPLSFYGKCSANK